MHRKWLKLGAVVVASVALGCGEDNPKPTADMSSPQAGMDALEQMKKGGTGPTTGINTAKAAPAPAPSK